MEEPIEEMEAPVFIEPEPVELPPVEVAPPPQRRPAQPTAQQPAPVRRPPTQRQPLPATEAIAVVRDLTKVFGSGEAQVAALRGVELFIGKGRLTAIVGRSGSGKTTLLHCLAGLEAPTSGSIEVAGQTVSAMSARQRSDYRRASVGQVFPADNLLPALTAAENIRLPLAIAKQSEDRQWYDQVVDSFRLGDILSRRPGLLSLAQQQRVACARAMILRPAIVLADEPTSCLDSDSEEQLMAMLTEFVAHFGQTVVLATHDSHIASNADQVFQLLDGQVVERTLGGGSLR